MKPYLPPWRRKPKTAASGRQLRTARRRVEEAELLDELGEEIDLTRSVDPVCHPTTDLSDTPVRKPRRTEHY